jgi:ADP-ribosylglycohydrolase
MYCLWARAILLDFESPWTVAEGQLRQLAGPGSALEAEAEKVLDPRNATHARGTGYVLDTLWSARMAVDGSESYEQCVRRAIRFGHDTDTTSAVAGGIAGLKFGAAAIPERWRVSLRGESIYRPLLNRLLAHAACPESN